MSRLRHTLGLLLLEERAPGKALQRLNRVSLAGVGGRLATALVGVLDTRTGSIAFSSAGHPSPVRVESGQAVELPVPPGRRWASSTATTRTTSSTWTGAAW